MPDDTAIGGPHAAYPTTRWSLIHATEASPDDRHRALNDLLTRYWKPLFVYVCRKGATTEHAKDLVQGFYAHLLEKDIIPRADEARGRFRTYLRVAMDHYRINEYHKHAAQKRGGGQMQVRIDVDISETTVPSHDEPPDVTYDRQWAIDVMQRALVRLEDEFRSGQRTGPFEAVVRYFSPTMQVSYEETASDFGLSVSQLKSTLHRTRLRFREIVSEEVRETLDDATLCEDEIDALIKALRG